MALCEGSRPEYPRSRYSRVVDTGFSEQLSLPSTWIKALFLPEVGYDDVIVADGRQILVTIHEGKIIWDGQERVVLIHCMEGDALVGMALMADYLLNLPVRINSVVTLSPLP